VEREQLSQHFAGLSLRKHLGAAFSRNLFWWLAAASEVNCWRWDRKKSFPYHKGGQTLTQRPRKFWDLQP